MSYEAKNVVNSGCSISSNSSYYEESVYFENKAAKVQLAGTITVPSKESIGTVILVAGYGRNDRDNTMMGHRPFSVLADFLACRGITVVRFDKRGVGASTGTYETATSEDFAQDVDAVVRYLVERTDKPLGIIGFSEGGLIATMVAARNQHVKGIALMAPALVTDSNCLVQQMSMQFRADGATDEFIYDDAQVRTAVYETVKNETNLAAAQAEVKALLENYCASLSDAQRAEGEKLMLAITAQKIALLTNIFAGPWYRFFLTCDTQSFLAALQIPALIVTGGCDHIVSSSYLSDFVLRHWNRSNPYSYTFKNFPELNHSFQTCKTGALAEYAASKEAIAPEILDLLAQWMLDTVIRS